MRPVLHVIPVCPFCQRVEILLTLKGRSDTVDRRVVDMTRPRDPAFLTMTHGTTALPVLETARGVLKESLVLMRYLDALDPGTPVARTDPYERAVEDMLVALEGGFAGAGYRLVLNQDPAQRGPLTEALLAEYHKLDTALRWRNPEGPWLFDHFGFAEAVYTPIFQRFWFLDYYEGFVLPESGFERVRAWRDACLSHPAAAQVSREQIVKVYYDYAQGAGNGALLAGRRHSSFAFTPDWAARPWPPARKYTTPATDVELGLG